MSEAAEPSVTRSSQAATPLQALVDQLPEDVFVGGPRAVFERLGRLQLVVLLCEGVQPWSRVLDVGCGCLRAGYWLIHFLDEGRYFGIEPDPESLRLGTTTVLEPGVLDAKRPRFDGNSAFDLTVFGEAFDYVLARSIWTHASKGQIARMLDSFVEAAAPGGILLASYLPASGRRDDFIGDSWVGRSHTSEVAGVVRHSLRWIQRTCAERGLCVQELRYAVAGEQVWLRIQRPTVEDTSARRSADVARDLLTVRPRGVLPTLPARLARRH